MIEKELDTAIPNELKAKVMSNAFKAVEHFFHEPSKTYIYYCTGLSHLGVKGIGAFPNESYENFQRNLSNVIEPANKTQLRSWDKILQVGVKKAELELKLKYLSTNNDQNISMKVSVADRLDKQYIAIRQQPTIKKVFLNTFVKIVSEIWKEVYSGVYEEDLLFKKELKQASEFTYDSSKRINLSVPSEIQAMIKVMADELDVKGPLLTKTIANRAARTKEQA
jgi:hypothetical protein